MPSENSMVPPANSVAGITGGSSRTWSSIPRAKVPNPSASSPRCASRWRSLIHSTPRAMAKTMIRIGGMSINCMDADPMGVPPHTSQYTNQL